MPPTAIDHAVDLASRPDLQFESNLVDVQQAVEALGDAPSLEGLRSACQALRSAKLLLFALRRSRGHDSASLRRLVQLARKAKDIAEHATPAAPLEFREGFAEVVESLEFHVRDLGKF